MTDENKLVELFNQLYNEKKTKVDYVTEARNLTSIYDLGTKKYYLSMTNPEVTQPNLTFEINEICHDQIASKTRIPNQFYQRIRTDHPELLLQNINTLIQDKEKVMIRTLNGKARALLSNRYRPIDNYDVMSASLETLNKIKESQKIDIQIMRGDVTETNFYLKVTSPQYNAKVGKDIVHGGIIVSNSEVGYGRFSVKMFIGIIVCNNGLISDKSFSRVHLGSAKQEQIMDWSDKTLELEDLTLFSKLTDMINETFSIDKFGQWIDELNLKADNIISQPTIAINNVIKNYGLPKEAVEGLLLKFSNYGYTQWGLSQTVTEYAHEQPNYNKQIELETVGNEIMKSTPEQLVITTN